MAAIRHFWRRDLAPYLQPDDLATIHQPLDYFGVNHYSPNYTKHDPDAVLGYSNRSPAPRRAGDRYGVGDQPTGVFATS